MAKEIAQAIHDGETKVKATMGIAFRKPVEFAEMLPNAMTMFASSRGQPIERRI
jgi:hypothetical protein